MDDDAFGADKITLKPYIPEGIDFVDCSFETIRGTIVSKWKRQEDGNVAYHVEIPPMTKAVVEFGGEKHTLDCGVYTFISKI